MKPFSIPVVALGPGSHVEDESLHYLEMPKAMHTYMAPILPEPEEILHRQAARLALRQVFAALEEKTAGRAPTPIDILGLPSDDRVLVNQVLGEGEVGAQVNHGTEQIRIQESVFAGVWRVRRFDQDDKLLADQIEVAEMPAIVTGFSNLGMIQASAMSVVRPGPGVGNTPSLLAEIQEQAGSAVHHVLNLTLLPFSPEDGEYLDQALGRGPITILSRGYGNCRITATGVARVWWVQFFNSQDVLILNTIEIADVPEVALAADEDIADSLERMGETLDWLG
jgi:hydrogenase-1 operon protein HyaF